MIPVVGGPRKHLDDAIPAPTDDPSPVLTPHHAADALPAHQPVARDFLRARSFLHRPEAEAGVVACRDEFRARGREGEGRDGGRVGEHVIRALTWEFISRLFPGREKGDRLTAVGVKESDIAIFVPAEYHALYAATQASRAMDNALIFRYTSSTVEAYATFQPNGRSSYCINACPWGTVVCFQARHAHHLFCRASVVDENRGIRERYDEGFAGHG